jgi:hypothetical protein
LGVDRRLPPGARTGVEVGPVLVRRSTGDVHVVGRGDMGVVGHP